ncbi:barstar family protein [Chryseobacterium limigenitum]|uniref:Barstar, RNAse (Barnase) inhibitor n=1 Tax=Chryseobacterium limigenitum TaxID=1612149 RepID=A0A1K2IJ24_9FLAO|nr:barstar family protein [Chryseobacterium limigenitum]SFZ92294.1 Barstar, RNAse (barnase) inhibitor [Chryseobacterium limigenitum]
MFAFSLDTLEEPELIAYFEDVKNLENNKTNFGYRKLRLINVHNIPKLKSEIERATKIYDNQGHIHLLDENKSIIAGTFLSNIRIIKSKNNNVTLSSYVWHHPKGFHKAYKMMVNKEITNKNLWKAFKKDELQGWLVFALHYNKSKIDKENIKIQIDGKGFHNLDEFFCLLGEEINGIGGYFGRNLYALYDCLKGDFGVKSISELTWNNHEKSKKLLKTKFNEIIETFEEFDVKIILK